MVGSSIERNINSNPESIHHDKNNSNTSSLQGLDQTPIDPQLSPDGTMVAFVMNGNLFVVMTSCDDDSTNNINDDDNISFNDDDDHHHPQDNPIALRIDPSFIIPKNHSTDIPYYYPVQITFTPSEKDILETTTMEKDDSCKNYNIPWKKVQGKKRYGHVITHGLAEYVAQ